MGAGNRITNKYSIIRNPAKGIRVIAIVLMDPNCEKNNNAMKKKSSSENPQKHAAAGNDRQQRSTAKYQETKTQKLIAATTLPLQSLSIKTSKSWFALSYLRLKKRFKVSCHRDTSLWSSLRYL